MLIIAAHVMFAAALVRFANGAYRRSQARKATRRSRLDELQRQARDRALVLENQH